MNSFLFVLLGSQIINYIDAIPAIEIPFEVVQPDGTVVKLMGQGDEMENYLTDESGYGVIQNESGEYVYVDEMSDGVVVATTEKVKGKDGPNRKNMKKFLHEKQKGCVKRLCGEIKGRKQDPKPVAVAKNTADKAANPNIRGRKTANGKDGKNRGSEKVEDGNGIRVIDVPVTDGNEASYTLEDSNGGRRRTEDIFRDGQKKTGLLKNLVILLQFKDHSETKQRSEQIPTEEDVGVLMNGDVPDPTLNPVGSLKTIYQELSFGELTIESTVTEWFVTAESEAWYADGSSGSTNLHEAIREALDYLDNNNMIDFTEFDMDDNGKIDSITVLHSGYAAEWMSQDAYGANYKDRIWSHKWSLWSDSSGEYKGPWTSKSGVNVWEYHISPAVWGTSGSDIGRIGVIAHETGHFLGLPDLYDGQGGRGIGKYCLMGNSWGWDQSQNPPGTMSCWTRMQLGWVVPKSPQNGMNSISDSISSKDCYKIGDGEYGYPKGEYLLIENRQSKGLDSKLPQGGLAIFHIDESAPLNDEGHPGQDTWPENGLHYRVALLQADRQFHLERKMNYGDKFDLFHGGLINELGPSIGFGDPFPNTDSYQGGNVEVTGIKVFDISTSGDTMTFQFSDGSTEAPSTSSPSFTPTVLASSHPTISPSSSPSRAPTVIPTTTRPTASPSSSQTGNPTLMATFNSFTTTPSDSPSGNSTVLETLQPSNSIFGPTTVLPSLNSRPSLRPSKSPSIITNGDSTFSSADDPAKGVPISSHATPTSWALTTSKPSLQPTRAPTPTPTSRPSLRPTSRPTETPCTTKFERCVSNEDCCDENVKCKQIKKQTFFSPAINICLN